MPMFRIPASRWFLCGATSLMVFLFLAVLLAGLMLTYRSYQPRFGEVAGNSMEPSLQGPRYLVTCGSCQTVIPFTVDAWNPNRPAICPCCGQPVIADDALPVQRGETIQYLPPQRLRRRSKAPGADKVLRGDIVVLEREAGSIKELKRVVGLPNETITLREGDLWINDQRHEKTLRETLSQSVLVAVWDPRFSDQYLDGFLDSLSLPPTNELPINAHDSHLLIPTSDIGIALRCEEPMRQGRLAMVLWDMSHRYEIEVVLHEDWSVTCNGLTVPQQTSRLKPEGAYSNWIILAMIDGRLLIGDESGRCLASPLDSLRTTAEESHDESHRSRMVITRRDIPEIDLAIVFRDLVYRGYGDAAEETIPQGPGYVVLGDNVSISDDSRGPAGGSVRWDLERIKGVVLSDNDDLASLLRQAEMWRSCGTRH